MARLRILIAVLNWGLGHATRCQPIIDECCSKGHEVHLASDGLAALVLEKNNPGMRVHRLAPLEIRYGSWFWLKLISQSLYIFYWLWQDHKETRRLQHLYQYDLILSDSRPVCRMPGVPGILIINQPSPEIPRRWLAWLTHRLLWTMLRQFDEIWIPDLPGNKNLSGKLIFLPSDIKKIFVGFLTRIKPPTPGSIDPKPRRILAILSGPEPTRTQFEQELTRRLAGHDYIIAGGRPDRQSQSDRHLSYLDPPSLSMEIAKAEYLICRSGYSSLMDLAQFEKKLILVPTPGQSEQEYLAERLKAKGMALIWNMKTQSLETILNESRRIRPFHFENESGLLHSAIQKWEEYCQKKSNLHA